MGNAPVTYSALSFRPSKSFRKGFHDGISYIGCGAVEWVQGISLLGVDLALLHASCHSSFGVGFFS